MGKCAAEVGEDLPSDAMNFWNLAWFEYGVGYAAKGCAYIEGDNEGARGPGVGLAHVRGGLHRGGWDVTRSLTEMHKCGCLEAGGHASPCLNLHLANDQRLSLSVPAGCRNAPCR